MVLLQVEETQEKAVLTREEPTDFRSECVGKMLWAEKKGFRWERQWQWCEDLHFFFFESNDVFLKGLVVSAHHREYMVHYGSFMYTWDDYS